MKKKIAFFILFIGSVIQPCAQIVWDSEIDVNAPGDGNVRPKVAADALGNPLVVWEHSGDVEFSRWEIDSFSPALALNYDEEGSWSEPAIVSFGDTVYVTMRQHIESTNSNHIFCLYSYDAGGSFSNPVQVNMPEDNLCYYTTVTCDVNGNPVVGFMKMDKGFTDPRWMVGRSFDHGQSFIEETLASGWSSETAEVCDCCPGTITSEGNTVAMVYRDNDDNLRDTWLGVSTDSGSTFSEGLNVDQGGWVLNACPSSGPDAALVNGNLYTTYMSGAGGSSRVYFSEANLNNMTCSGGEKLTDDFDGLSIQNYPSIASSGSAIAVVFKQSVSGSSELPIFFTNDISEGMPTNYELVSDEYVINADVALTEDAILVVWQRNPGGTVRFRKGTYSSNSITDTYVGTMLSVFPNPSSATWTLSCEMSGDLSIELYSTQGQLIYSENISKKSEELNHELIIQDLKAGLYYLCIVDGNENKYSVKLIKE